MRVRCVHLEFHQHVATQGAFREHAANSLLEDSLRMALHDPLVRNLGVPTGVVRIAGIDHRLGLVARQTHLLGIGHHDKIARIEVGAEDIARLLDPQTRQTITQAFKSLGFTYITLDLEGYRTGSLNETLPDKTE